MRCCFCCDFFFNKISEFYVFAKILQQEKVIANFFINNLSTSQCLLLLFEIFFVLPALFIALLQFFNCQLAFLLLLDFLAFVKQNFTAVACKTNTTPFVVVVLLFCCANHSNTNRLAVKYLICFCNNFVDCCNFLSLALKLN